MLYFFLLLTPPPAPACVLWIDHPPLVADYRPPACPLDLMLAWDWYDLRLISMDGVVLCEWPAAGSGLTTLPCRPSPYNNYHIEVWLNSNVYACDLKTFQMSESAVALQCPDWLDKYKAGELEIRGPFDIWVPPMDGPACKLPKVDNTSPLATNNDYQFLAGRLAWWGIEITQVEWQNRYDEQIRGAADVSGVPAILLKGMLANESQFWPLWTGDAGEVGWLQLTWDGADTALRHDRELFTRYCNRAIWSMYCTDYDVLTPDQQYTVRSELVADLTVTGTPVQAAAQAAADLWIYAHILRAYACQAQELYPERDVWQAAAIIYNAGTSCIRGEAICKQGKKYLEEIWNH